MPWNKGKKMSLESRVRMSLAKQGTTLSRTTRRSMSRAHLSLSHSPVSHTAFFPVLLFWLHGGAARALQTLPA